MKEIRDHIAGRDVLIRAITSTSDYDEVLEFASSQKPMAFDTESTGLNPYHPQWRLRLFQFGHTRRVYVIPAKFRELIYEVIEFPRTWIAHNAPHDVRAVDRHLKIESGILPQCIDTYIPSHLDDPRSAQEGGIGHQLKDLGIAYVDPVAAIAEVELKKAFKQITVPIEGEFYKSGPRKGQQKVRTITLAEGWGLIHTYHPAYLRYAGIDPVLTMWVWRYFKEKSWNSKLFDWEHRVQIACDDMVRRGFRVNVPYARKLRKHYVKVARKSRLRAFDLGVENINSTIQVADALILNGANLTQRTPTGRFKVDDKVLKGLEGDDQVGQLIDAILTAKRADKRRASYVDHFLLERDRYDRVHANINPLAARTARMSMSNPPLQQLPIGEHLIRSCLIADPGMLIISCDFDQIELRVAAALAGEKELIDAAFRGESLHKTAAVKLFGPKYTNEEYRYTKNVNFGWLYGGGAYTLSRQAGIPMAKAQTIIANYQSQFLALSAYKRRITNQVLRSALTPHELQIYNSIRQQYFEFDESTAGQKGKTEIKKQLGRICYGKYGTVVTPFGRKLKVDAYRAYSGTNYIVQSASRDLMAGGLLRVWEDEELRETMLLIIHDELLGQARKRKAEYIANRYAELMTTEFEGVPITASGKVYGRSWGDGYKEKVKEGSQ